MSGVLGLFVLLTTITSSVSNPSIYQDRGNIYNAIYNQQTEMPPPLSIFLRHVAQIPSSTQTPRKPGNDQGFHGRYTAVSNFNSNENLKIWLPLDHLFPHSVLCLLLCERLSRRKCNCDY